MKQKFFFILAVVLLHTMPAEAQGPPIIGDKAIMLGQSLSLVRNLTEIRSTSVGTFTQSQLMFHYLPTSRSLFAVHIPAVYRSGFASELDNGGLEMGDIQLKGKYQFYVDNGIGETFRIAAVLLQNLPTSTRSNTRRLSPGEYMSYQGLIFAYESVHYGLAGELAYTWEPTTDEDSFVQKVSVGLPLLTPAYPLKQINLYFEYRSQYHVETGRYELLASQGIQYAYDAATVEVAYQTPLVQSEGFTVQQLHSWYLGARYAF